MLQKTFSTQLQSNLPSVMDLYKAEFRLKKDGHNDTE